MSVKDILNEAYKRGTHRMTAFEATMRDIADLEGMRQDLEQERVVTTSDTEQRMLELQERLENHAEGFISAIKDAYDNQVAAERLIESLDNPRWKQVLTCRYIAQMTWSEVAAQLHTTDDAVKRLRDRAIENLDAREKLKNCK